MLLYHGTNISFDVIDLGKCKPNKDFGKGFYTTKYKDQAELLKECIVSDVVSYIVEDEKISIPDAFEMFYTSNNFTKLQDSETGMYFQSSQYTYDIFLEELKHGKFVQCDI